MPEQTPLRYRLFPLIPLLLLAFALGGCAGPTLQELSPQQTGYSMLNNDEQREIERIRQQQLLEQGMSPQVESFIAESRQLTALEYINSPYYAPEKKGENYRIGGKDVLRVDVYEEPDLSKEAVAVTENGTITLPLLGQVRIAGLTTPELESILERMYRDKGILLEPQVSITVEEYLSQHVLVLGQISSPGRYPLTASEKLLDVLAEARKSSSYNKETSTVQRVKLIRTFAEDKTEERLTIEVNVRRLMSGMDQFANFMLQGGDIIFVPKPDKFYVLGQVDEPGEYILDDPDRPINIVEAIGMAGGYTRYADPNRSTIVRFVDNQQLVLRVRVEDIAEKGYEGGDITIHANDVIVVPAKFTQR
jgi:polysaccharide export outer membrane protein